MGSSIEGIFDSKQGTFIFDATQQAHHESADNGLKVNNTLLSSIWATCRYIKLILSPL